MSLTIVVPTFKRIALLPRLLARLVAETEGHGDVDVIVIDNAGEPPVRALVENAARGASVPLRYIHADAPGVAHVRNVGLQRASGDVVVYIDDDVVPYPGWLAAISRCLADRPRHQLYGGPIDPVSADLSPLAVPRERELIYGALHYPEERFDLGFASPRMVLGGNLVVDRALAGKAGGFHPAFARRGNNLGSLEDHEFFLRFTRAGATGVFDSRIRVQTIVPEERRGMAYARRWKAGHGFYSALLEFLLSAIGDSRATSSSPAHALAPKWAVRELLSLAHRRDEDSILRRDFLRGYLRGAARLVTSRSLRQSLLEPAPLAR